MFPFKVRHVGAYVRLLAWASPLRSDHSVNVMAAIAADDERDVDLLAAELDGPRVALVVMGVAREECMGIYAFLLADRVDLLEHRGAAAVIAAGAPGPLRRRVAERRMVRGEQNGAGIFLLLDSFQLGPQKIDLHIGYGRPFLADI